MEFVFFMMVYFWVFLLGLGGLEYLCFVYETSSEYVKQKQSSSNKTFYTKRAATRMREE